MAAVDPSLLNLVRDLGLFAAGTAALGWVARDAIRQYFDKQLQGFQSGLNKELQAVQSQLDCDNMVYSQLHAERVEVVSELYRMLVEFDEEMQRVGRLTNEEREKEGSLDQAVKLLIEFRQYYSIKKIYFPKRICSHIEQLLPHYGLMVMEAGNTRIGIYLFALDTMLNEYSGGRSKNEQVEKLKGELEDHFGELLGVDVGGTSGSNYIAPI